MPGVALPDSVWYRGGVTRDALGSFVQYQKTDAKANKKGVAIWHEENSCKSIFALCGSSGLLISYSSALMAARCSWQGNGVRETLREVTLCTRV